MTFMGLALGRAVGGDGPLIHAHRREPEAVVAAPSARPVSSRWILPGGARLAIAAGLPGALMAPDGEETAQPVGQRLLFNVSFRRIADASQEVPMEPTGLPSLSPHPRLSPLPTSMPSSTTLWRIRRSMACAAFAGTIRGTTPARPAKT